MAVKKVWVLIADAAGARVLRADREGRRLELLRTTRTRRVAPNQAVWSRTVPVEPRSSHTGARHAMEPDTDLKRAELRRFVHRLATELDAAASAGSFDQLVIVAADRVLGELRNALPPRVAARICQSKRTWPAWTTRNWRSAWRRCCGLDHSLPSRRSCSRGCSGSHKFVGRSRALKNRAEQSGDDRHCVLSSPAYGDAPRIPPCRFRHGRSTRCGSQGRLCDARGAAPRFLPFLTGSRFGAEAQLPLRARLLMAAGPARHALCWA